MSVNPRELSRRELLASSVKATATLVVGSGFVLHTSEGWAAETTGLSPHAMATIIQIARDTYPHDAIPDRNYALAVKSHDEQAATDQDHARMMESGVRVLDFVAEKRGFPDYLSTGWEVDRVGMLRAIEDTPFFQAIRGGLIVGLYNQKEIWGHFGYEGASFEQGGYLDRGFDDIAWL